MYRQKRSIVWQYFEKKTPTTAMCLLCKREYKSASNTTNLHEHLKRKHFTVLQANQILHDEEAQLIEIEGSGTPNIVQRRQLQLRQLTLRTISNELEYCRRQRVYCICKRT